MLKKRESRGAFSKAGIPGSINKALKNIVPMKRDIDRKKGANRNKEGVFAAKKIEEPEHEKVARAHQIPVGEKWRTR